MDLDIDQEDVDQVDEMASLTCSWRWGWSRQFQGRVKVEAYFALGLPKAVEAREVRYRVTSEAEMGGEGGEGEDTERKPT